MSFGTILYTVLISPLQLFFEFVFSFAQMFTGDQGLSIIVLSLAMNFLVLPLYKRADAMQAEERETEARLHDGLAHIKKVFSGDERMMIQQEYYRQNHYKAADAFKGSVSLFLEIPFFIGAYQFLSNLQTLRGVSFGPLSDLGAPDGLLIIGGLTVNLLPILMTAVNMVSSIIYTKGFPRKTKIQLYVMAVFFLFFLYNSPSGLVFYWTLNNVFSLCKNVFYKMKDPYRVLSVMSSVTGVFLTGAAIRSQTYIMDNRLILSGIGLALELPLIIYAVKKKRPAEEKTGMPDKRIFLLSAVLLTVITGLLIPSAVIRSSPQEFVDVYNYRNPLWYIVSAFCLSSGTFLIWVNVFYHLAGSRGKIAFERVMWVVCGVSVADYFFFATDLGILSSTLQYQLGFYFSVIQILGNAAVLVAVGFAMMFVLKHFKKVTIGVLTAGTLAIFCMAAVNSVYISNSVKPLKQQAADEADSEPVLELSKTGKNVVVIMLDRAIGPYIPYLFNEKPELKTAFDGFTYYSNTISFGGFTNFGAPALFGGYEYTPEQINKRSSQSLVSKQNEALKVMPVLFDQNGYDVTVCDPTYANYQYVPDLTIYEDYPDIHTYITDGRFNSAASVRNKFNNTRRNFFCYSLMKSSPLPLQWFLYDYGNYMKPGSSDENEYSIQTQQGNSVGNGLDESFMSAYNVLADLPEMTKTDSNTKGSFVMLTNDTTHEATLLQEPQYEPKMNVDNTSYDEENRARFTIDGRTVGMTDLDQYGHYEVNMAAMIQLGKWFDYLRENDLYDNTRIILVSDHGRPLKQFKELIHDNGDSTEMDMEWYTPLLMVKDFNSKGFKSSEEFMTNGDVPTIAVSDLIKDPVNPMTGNPLSNAAKHSSDQYVIASRKWSIYKNNGNVFLPADWYSIHGNIWNTRNWKRTAVRSTAPHK